MHVSSPQPRSAVWTSLASLALASTQRAWRAGLVVVLLLVLAACAQDGGGSDGDLGRFGEDVTVPFSFTPIPFANTDLVAPGRGVEVWNGVAWDDQHAPKVPAGNTQGDDEYVRLGWRNFQTTSATAFDFSTFDVWINRAIDNNRKFSFSIMNLYTGGSGPVVGGGKVTFPDFLHTQMQSDTVDSRDWIDSITGAWIPNWNSTYYIAAWQNLLNAVATHIASGSHNGKSYRNVIGYIDIRGYGDFGEWHTWPWYGTEPTGRTATVATLETIIDASKTAFPDIQLVGLIGMFDDGNASRVPPEVGYYALTSSNHRGRFGWRRDQWGDANTDNILVDNSYSWNGTALKTLIMDAWKYGPVVGEPNNSLSGISSCGSPHCDLEREIRLYHATSFGNGNYPLTSSQSGWSTLVANVVASSKASGYRLVLTGGSVTALSPGSAFTVNLGWQNVGIAPTYEDWNVTYELRTSSGTVAWSGTSAFLPRLFLPLTSATPATDTFTLPASVATGSYNLFVIVRDPHGYRAPLPLAINGRNADGSYLLAGVNVAAGGANQAPTVNAGADETLQLPTNATTLTATASDSDGTIASYAWVETSGPAATLAGANSATLSLSALLAGTYVFKVTVTDNEGAIASDSVQVKVNGAGVAPESLWPASKTPAKTGSGAQFYELGTQFSPTTAGSITALRVYALAAESGAHTARLWRDSDNTVVGGPYAWTYGGAAGWVTLDIPDVPVQAGVTYTVSVTTSGDGANRYPYTNNDLPTAGSNGAHLTYPASAGVNTTTAGSRPTATYNATNYLRDVVFVADQPPTVNAGVDTSVQLPTSTATLTALASDPDGTIAAYSWVKTSGPTATMTGTSTPTLSLSALVAGTYLFTVTVTDNLGLTATDSVQVTVNAAPSAVPVIWTSAVGVIVSGNDLTKAGQTYAWDSGAVSTQTIGALGGYVEFTVDEANTALMFGLGNGNTDQGAADIAFAVYLASGTFQIYEGGIDKSNFGAYQVGDKFRVTVSGTTVTYSKNGTVFYSSSTGAMFPLLVDTSFYSAGSSISNAVLLAN